MGLDVYLYRYDDFAATNAAETAAEEFSTKAWEDAAPGKKYDEMTDAQRESARSACATFNATLGLDEWGTDKARKQKIEIDSAKYPEHYFKIGYFRSSYNEGGIDRVAEATIGMRLSDVFQTGERYEFQPDWKLARECAVEFHRKLAAAPTLRVSTVDAVSIFDGQARPDARAAVSIVQRERGKERHADFSSFSNRDGTFFLGNPLPLVAAIPGTGVFRNPCVHLVYDDAEGFAWYVQAAEIIIETIDYVLAQPDVEKYWLHWSG